MTHNLFGRAAVWITNRKQLRLVLTIWFLFVSTINSSAQYWLSPPMSSIPRGGAAMAQGYTTSTLNSAGDWLWLFWVPAASKTLSKFMFRVSSVTGTLGANDIRVELLAVPWPTAFFSSVTYSDAADTITVAGGTGPLANGQTVMFSNTSGDASLPAGISASTVYYICNKSGTTIQIDDDSGCASVVTDFSGASGTSILRRLLQASTTVTTTPTGAAWVEVTGFSTALSGGTPYALLIRNMNAVDPALNYFVVMQPYAPAVGASLPSATVALGWVSSATYGGDASQSGGHSGGYRLEYSDASFEGLPLESVALSDHAAGTTIVGSRYVIPAGIAPRVKCIALAVATDGTPAADLVVKLYTGADGSESLAGTSEAMGQNYVSSSTATNGRMACFSSAVALSANSVVRVMASSEGSTGTNSYVFSKVSIQDSAGSKALVFGGAKYCTYNGSSWTYTDTAFIPVAFILDPVQPYTAGAGTAATNRGFVQ